MDGRRAEERRKGQRFNKEGSKKQRGEKTLEKSYSCGKEKNGEKRRKQVEYRNAEKINSPRQLYQTQYSKEKESSKKKNRTFELMKGGVRRKSA